MNKKAVVAGHMCIDMTPKFNNPPVDRMDEILGPGLVVDIGKSQFNPGGCVSNTGLALNFFGADVTLMGKIGEDYFGSMLKKKYEESAVNLSLKIDKNNSTGYTIVISPNGLDRMFLHNSGTNLYTRNEDFDKDIIKDANVFHFGYPTLMPQYLSNNCSLLIDLYKEVKKLNTVTSMDLTMPDHNSDIKNMDWDKIFKDLLPNVDIFLPSFEEIQYIFDNEKYFELYKKAGGGDISEHIDFKKDVEPIADRLLSYGCAIVVIKCGPLGLYLKTSDKARLDGVCKNLDLDLNEWSEVSITQKSFLADRVLAATGAGDTSIAAFLYSLMRGENPSSALEYAAGAGASCVTEYDSISGLISFDKMREKIDNGWKTNS